MSTGLDPECPLTELPASMCACTKHRNVQLEDADPEPIPVATTFTARYAGVCSNCAAKIEPGDVIGMTEARRYVCGRCTL